MDDKTYKEIQILADPLLELDITYFQFVEIDEKGKMLFLCNDIDWYDYFSTNQLYLKSNFKNMPASYQNGYILCQDLPVKKGIVDKAEEHNIAHGITLVEKTKNTCQFYLFATKRENERIINTYFYNLDLLKRYILYFRDKAYKIIRDNSMKKFNTRQENDGINHTPLIHLSSEKINRFVSKTEVNKFFCYVDDDVYLTKREAKCLKWYVLGKSANEIGEILNLSARTVEAHINNLKRKFNCTKQSQLSFLIAKSGFDEILFE